MNGTFSFWDHVHTLFLNRDSTRHDVRELVRRGLAATSGNYRAPWTIASSGVVWRRKPPSRSSLIPLHRQPPRGAATRAAARPH